MLWPDGINNAARLASVRERLDKARKHYERIPWLVRPVSVNEQREMKEHVKQVLADADLMLDALERYMSQCDLKKEKTD